MGREAKYKDVDFFTYYFRHSYVVQSLVMFVKEFVAVLVQLVCYARLGGVDLFNGGLVLYMVLVVFSFPFLNSYLFGFLRFGMWWDVAWWDAGYRYKVEWIGRTFAQFVFVTLFQVFGALTAAKCVSAIESRWGDAVLYSITDPGKKQIGVLYATPSTEFAGYGFAEEFCAVFILLVGLLHLIWACSASLLVNAYWVQKPVSSDAAPQQQLGSHVNGGDVVGEEEPVDTVGELRTIASSGFAHQFTGVEQRLDAMSEALSNGLGELKTVLQRVESNRLERSSPADVATVEVSAVDRNQGSDNVPNKYRKLRPLPGSPARPPNFPGLPVLPDVVESMYMPYLDTGSFFMGANSTRDGLLPTSTPRPAAPAYVKKPSLPIQPIPATLILHASLLVLAISRAFPSAHQSLHLTVYLWGKGIITDNNVAIERIGGGYTACVVALAYYWFWYVYAGNAAGDGNSDGAKVLRNVRRNVVDPIPAFLRADMRGLGYVRVAD